MEIEEFDEDEITSTTTRTAARDRPIVAGGSSRTQAPYGGRAPVRGGFGLANELETDLGAGPDRNGLAGDLQRLDIHDSRPQPPSAFGLAAEVNPPLAPLGPPNRGALAAPPPRSRLGRTAAAAASPPGPGAFGLAAETAAPSQPQPAPSSSSDYGLASEVAQPQPQYTAAAIAQDPPAFGSGRRSSHYGLDADVRSAAAPGTAAPGGGAGGLPPPPGGYGLTGEIEVAQMPEGQFGLASEVGPMGPAPLPVPGQPPWPGGMMAPPQQYQQQPQMLQPPPPEGYYGLSDDIAEYDYQQQHQRLLHEQAEELWAQQAGSVLSLEQLAQFPEEQRWLHLSAIQADAVIQQMRQQRGAPQPRVVDVREVRDKLLDSSAPPRLAYLTALEQAAPDRRLPDNCRASLLQAKLKAGQNRLRKLIEPTLDPSGQGFVDLRYSADGALLPENTRVWEFGLGLVRADGVGKTDLQRVRAPCLFITRIALFDRRANRFLGNVLGMRPEAVSQYDKRWEFNPEERIIVRCGCVQSDPQAGTRLVTDDALSLFVEFNVSYRLAVEDTTNMPQSEHRCSQLLDEINTCWAMVSFSKCVSLTREVSISVPLYFGSIYNPTPMTAFYAHKRSKTPVLSAFKPRESPMLQLRVGPLNTGKTPLVPYAFMPSTLLATHDLATALAAYRMSAALVLGRQSGPFAAAADPVLSGFPPLLSDPHLLAEFLARWRDLTTKMSSVLEVGGCCAPEVLPPLSAMVEAFRRCTIELAPLAHCPTIPPRHINNFVEYQGHRLRLVQHYCHVTDTRSGKILGARHPVEPLSHAGFEFLHAPFDVSEIRVCMADRLERPEPFYKH